MTLTQVIEALLFAAQKPLTARELMSAIKGAGGEDELLRLTNLRKLPKRRWRRRWNN